MMPEADPEAAARPTWVFGYGSLVDPASLGQTLGRAVTPGDDFLEAELSGWGRRWNYGVGHVSGIWRTPAGELVDDGVIVALGLVASVEERVNGVVARVSDAELVALDRRERDYDRVDVSGSVAVAAAGVEPTAQIVTYVPRPAAVERYERARGTGRAGIRSSYWGRVDAAFAVLGPDRLERYRSSTPPPDVPVVAVIDATVS